MPKTKEEIKAEIQTLVAGQGNQGAICLADVLNDIVDAAIADDGGDGGDGGGE